MGKACVAPLKTVTIPRLELTAATVSVRVASMLKEELDYDGFQDFYWTVVRLSSGSSTMNLEDSKCMSQIECNSSVTTLHQTSGATWSLDSTQQMKHRGGGTLMSSCKGRSGLRAQTSCARWKITGLNKTYTKTRSTTILLMLKGLPLTRQ